MPTKAARSTASLIVAALALLAVGLFFGGHPSDLPAPLRSVFVADNDAAVRNELIQDVRDHYYKRVSTSQLENASLAGIINSLHDPYSEYFTPAQTKVFDEDVNGRFDGVGITVQPVKSGLLVEQVLPGSPAEGAGIHAGDEIVDVNGKSIAGVPSDVSTDEIRGPAGTTVKLALDVPRAAKRTVTLKRASIQIPVSTGRVVEHGGKKLGVVSLLTFSDGAHAAVREQVDKVLSQGARGIVLDLRNNGGGILNEGVLVASVFVDRGVIVSTRGRTQPTQRFDARGDAISPRIPVVVLVNGLTASAAEIVTGALRDHARATVIGTKTYGKGVFQDLEPLSNNGALKLTVGSYYLPDGENLAGHGIVPQVPASQNPQQRGDHQLQVALQALAQKIR